MLGGQIKLPYNFIFVTRFDGGAIQSKSDLANTIETCLQSIRLLFQLYSHRSIEGSEKQIR